MARLTRNSYKRKIIMFGIMLFVSIALVSTGFAAWVLSTQQVENKDGNVTVGAVSDHSFVITFGEVKDQYNETVSTLNFNFEPHKDDDTGRVRNDGTNFENMSLTFTGTITNFDYLGSYKVKMTVPTEIQAAANAGYIVLPACVGAEIELKTLEGAMTRTSDDNGGTATFTYKISFTWGTVFGGVNPGYYYDTNETGKAVEGSVVKSTLEAFYTAAHTADTEKYNITFTATAN